MNKQQMGAALQRREDLLMIEVAGLRIGGLVSIGLTPAQCGELAALLDAWLRDSLSVTQHLRARALADLAGIDLLEIDKIAVREGV